MNTSGEVMVSRQISHTRCAEGQTWGLSRHSVWVDKGCRAEFTNRSVQTGGSVRDSGGAPSSAIRACNAVQDRYGEVESATALRPGWWEIILRYDDCKYVCNVSETSQVQEFQRLRNQ